MNISIKQDINLKYFLILLLMKYTFLALGVRAQQMPRYSQYIMNEFIINPSIAGIDGRTTLNITARKEWLGFSSNFPTPETYSFSAQTRILKKPLKVTNNKFGAKLKESSKGRVGLGTSIFTDINGALRRTGFQVTYAYHIYSQNTQLSFGLTGSIIQLKFQSEHLVFKNNIDEKMLLIAENPLWMPDFGIGINYMSREFHLGVSVMQLFQSPFVFGKPGVNYNLKSLGYKRHYFIVGALHKNLPNNPNWEFEPSFLFKIYDLLNFSSGVNKPGSQLDVSVKFLYLSKYWFGLSYRTKMDIVIMTGVKYKNMFFTYSFDYGSGEMALNSYGSHEITISTKFGDSKRRYRWLERY
jgi:type IX secretion system PorP/SprF family membrane protein